MASPAMLATKEVDVVGQLQSAIDKCIHLLGNPVNRFEIEKSKANIIAAASDASQRFVQAEETLRKQLLESASKDSLSEKAKLELEVKRLEQRAKKQRVLIADQQALFQQWHSKLESLSTSHED
eukprot:m.260880 g.260880  ORF g.260880 m.260880 type:complete len:124 (-) comp40813_c0_seq1:427-798(-)